MKITRLKDHRIIKIATAVCRDYFVKCDLYTSGSDPSATERESYAIEAFRATSDVVRCIDQLYFSIEMLSGYRAYNTPGKMNRYDYVVFGIENYYLRLTSVFDRCLHLANVIFQLGLPERKCKKETIIKNTHAQSTAIDSALTELDKFTAKFRSCRNTVAHQSIYSERDLDKLGLYYYIAEEDVGFKRYRNIFKKKTDDFVSEKKKRFNDEVVNLECLVEIYLDSVVSIFEERLKAYI